MNISDKKQIVYQKNYRYLVTIHFDSIWSTSNRLRPNEYCCYLMITYQNANHLATIKSGVQIGATCPKVSSKIRKNKIERFSVFSSQKCWVKPKSMAVVWFPVQNYSVPRYLISVVQSTRSWKWHCWIVKVGKWGNRKSGKWYIDEIIFISILAEENEARKHLRQSGFWRRSLLISSGKWNSFETTNLRYRCKALSHTVVSNRAWWQNN